MTGGGSFGFLGVPLVRPAAVCKARRGSSFGRKSVGVIKTLGAAAGGLRRMCVREGESVVGRVLKSGCGGMRSRLVWRRVLDSWRTKARDALVVERAAGRLRRRKVEELNIVCSYE